jgi:broad specificity phosphatase PhoE
MSILLVRHAETAANAARVVQTPDLPLSARGTAQAERLAERLAREPIALILASDYERAAHTARSIARASGAPLEYDANLRERHFGDVRGRPYSEIGAQLFSPDYAPPNGETWAEFSSRVARAWASIGERASSVQGLLVVVTHGLFCQALALNHLALDQPLVPPPYGFGNASLTIIDREAPFRVRLLNCEAHLSSLDGSVTGVGP